MKWKRLLAVSAMSAVAATAYAGFKMNVYVPCLLKEYCVTYVPKQGELIENGAEPWFYPVQGTDYGSVLTTKPMTYQFIASNIGTGDLTVYGFSKKLGTGAFQYAKSDCPLDGEFVLKPGAACTVNVTFAPQATGDYADTLVLMHSSTLVPAVEKDVQGKGIELTPEQIEAEKTGMTNGSAGTIPKEEVPESPVTQEDARRGLRASTGILDFGRVMQGATVTPLSVQFYNDATEPVHPFSIKAKPGDLLNLTQNCFPEIPAKGSCTVTVGLKTADITETAYSGTIEILTSESVNGSATVAAVVQGSKVVASPNPLEVTATSGTEEGMSTITLSNTGNMAAEISDIALSNGTSSVSGLMGGANFTQKSRILRQGCGATLPAKQACSIDIGYTSAVEGADIGSITYKVNGVSRSVPVQAKMILPDLTLVGDGHDFGGVAMGSTATKTFIARNTGDKAVRITGINTSDQYLEFKNNQCNSELAVGDQCTFDVVFKGDVLNQVYRDHPFVVTNTGDLKAIRASVKGFSTGGYLAVDTTTLGFGRVEYAAAVAPKVVTLTNKGSDAINGLSIESTFAQFALNGPTSGSNCLTKTSLAGGASCSFSVAFDSFTPTGNKSVSGQINISSDATNTKSSYTIPVSGEVVGGILQATPATINFGDVTYGSIQERTVVVKNIGVRDVTIKSMVTDASRAMSVKDTTCTSDKVLAPNATCTVTIKMMTDLTAIRGAALSVRLITDTANGSLGISATGRPVGSWMTVDSPARIPDIKVGTTYRYGLVFVNSAESPLVIKNAQIINGVNANFTLVTNGCTAGYQQYCSVIFDVTPTTYGGLSAAVAVDTNDSRYPSYVVQVEGSAYDGGPNIALDGKFVSSYDAGYLRFGATKTITGSIVNKGEQSITVTSLSLPGWNVVGCSGATVAAGASCGFTLSTTMSPTTNAAAQVQTLSARFTNADSRYATISVTPEGSVAALSKTGHDFGNQVYQVQRSTTFTITNNGVSPLAFSGSWSSDANGEFAITDNCGLTLAKGATCTATVTFAPKVEDAREFTFQRPTSSIDVNGGVLSFKAQGFGLVGNPVVLATLQGTPGAKKSINVSVINKGNGGVVIQSFTLPNGSDYAATLTNPNNCSAIPSFGVCTYTLSYTVPAAGAAPLRAKLTFTGGPSPVEKEIAATDDSIASSCSAIKAEYPEAPTGTYLLNKWGNVQQVYCDQETDGGGWELAYVNSYELMMANPKFPIKFIPFGSFAKGGTLITSSPSSAMPALPNGFTNDFNRVLIKGGTTAWKAAVGEWVSFDTLTLSTNINSRFPNARSQKGVTTIAAGSIGWGAATVPSTEQFNMAPAYTANGVCGGAGWGVGKNCMSMSEVGSFHDSYWYHYEVRSYREVYFRY